MCTVVITDWLNSRLETPEDTRLLGVMRIAAALAVYISFGHRFAPYVLYPDVPAMLTGLVCTGALWLMAVGLFSRAAAVTAGALLIAMFFAQTKLIVFPLGLSNQGAFGAENALYFSGWLLLLIGLGPCGHSFSLDRKFRGASGPAPMWNLPLIRALVISVYLWTALAKLNSDFLDGEILKQTLILYYAGSAGYDYAMAPLLAGLAKLAVVLEFGLGLGLLFSKTRRPALHVGIAFHLSMALMIPVHNFTMAMMVAYLAFLQVPRK